MEYLGLYNKPKAVVQPECKLTCNKKKKEAEEGEEGVEEAEEAEEAEEEEEEKNVCRYLPMHTYCTAEFFFPFHTVWLLMGCSE
jgi:hypothetical protein